MSGNTSSILPPPALPIDPTQHTIYIQIKSANKEWNNESIMTEWSDKHETLANGEGDFAADEWMDCMKQRVMKNYKIHEKDIRFGFKLQAAPTNIKRKPPMRLEKYVYGKVNPLVDSLFIMISELHASDSDCPVNEKDKKKKKKSKTGRRKRSKQSSDDDESDVQQQNKRRKRRKLNKKPKNSEDDDSDYISRKDAQMYNQTMHLVIETYKGQLTGEGMAAWCGMIVEDPKRYQIDDLPDDIRRKYGIKGSQYKTSTTHSTPKRTQKPTASTTTIQQQQQQQQQMMMNNNIGMNNMMNPMMLGMIRNIMMNPMLMQMMNNNMNNMNITIFETVRCLKV